MTNGQTNKLTVTESHERGNHLKINGKKIFLEPEIHFLQEPSHGEYNFWVRFFSTILNKGLDSMIDDPPLAPSSLDGAKLSHFFLTLP